MGVQNFEHPLIIQYLLLFCDAPHLTTSDKKWVNGTKLNETS